jgi:hypothetical protein
MENPSWINWDLMDGTTIANEKIALKLSEKFIEMALDDKGWLPVIKLKAGDIILFYSRLPHRTPLVTQDRAALYSTIVHKLKNYNPEFQVYSTYLSLRADNPLLLHIVLAYLQKAGYQPERRWLNWLRKDKINQIVQNLEGQKKFKIFPERAAPIALDPQIANHKKQIRKITSAYLADKNIWKDN